jgi:hypothetical protein
MTYSVPVKDPLTARPSLPLRYTMRAPGSDNESSDVARRMLRSSDQRDGASDRRADAGTPRATQLEVGARSRWLRPARVDRRGRAAILNAKAKIPDKWASHLRLPHASSVSRAAGGSMAR